MNAPVAVVLAAGKGTRMKSELPKVLFPVCGRPMIHFVLDALQRAGVARIIVVVGYRADAVRAELAGRTNVEFVDQTEQLGTGHAVQMARPALEGHTGPVFVVAGDSPLLQDASLKKLLTHNTEHPHSALLGTLLKDDPTGLGRIVRDSAGKFTAIREHKDASEEERQIREVNMSTYLFDGPELLKALDQLGNNNAQGEYYITDVPAIMLAAGLTVDALPVLAECESLSINTLDELGLVEAKMAALGYPLNA
ncbi:MAG: NTP transferase domain-containing protein [Planctomycetaceae bacterium]|nr:NTP transferase domain-containing protein [Planctomycetaceae bacterium]